ncbi:MAG: thiamine/thiamine pyrophosphate ABC transporter permease [Rhizobiaceae bacterium]|nr:thiamine/thiamine pyrophosphate ABC transporter permease [Rhizobiaceae bacterium]
MRLDLRLLAGLAALGFLAALVGGAFTGMLYEGADDRSGVLGAFDAYLWRIARFTLWQAALSTLVSVVPAIALARALSRHPAFPGRAIILRLFALPLGLPAIVAALGLLELYGRAGYLAAPLGWIRGDAWPGIYGLSGILVAHAFFNIPLATRLFLESLDTVGNDQWRLASQLGMGAGSSFRFIEWPVMRAALPGIAGLVFMLCITSFTLVLTLGGGPRATTLEVAIYQSLRFDFDPARAVVLTIVQVALTALVLAMLSRLGASAVGEANLTVSSGRPHTAGFGEAVLNGGLIAAGAAFVVAPLAATLASGLQADLPRLATESGVLRAAATSLALASLSAGLAVMLALALLSGRRAFEAGRPSLLAAAMEAGAGFVLVVPPIVIGAGWFILLRHSVDVFAVAPVMVVAVNAAMAMPFAMRAIRPAHDASATRHDRLCASLGIAGRARLRLVDWPVLRRPILTAAAFAMALSLGDLGVIALFGSDAVQTLPYLLLQRMGSYRTADAAGIALLLGLLCLALMLIADRLGKEMPA